MKRPGAIVRKVNQTTLKKKMDSTANTQEIGWSGLRIYTVINRGGVVHKKAWGPSVGGTNSSAKTIGEKGTPSSGPKDPKGGRGKQSAPNQGKPATRKGGARIGDTTAPRVSAAPLGEVGDSRMERWEKGHFVQIRGTHQ